MIIKWLIKKIKLILNQENQGSDKKLYHCIFQNLTVLAFNDARWEGADNMIIVGGNEYRSAWLADLF